MKRLSRSAVCQATLYVAPIFCRLTPHLAKKKTRFIEKVQYKAKAYGINVIVRQESYTSKASALDFDEIPDYEKKEAHYSFSGKRIKRGLYRTSNGSLLNADVNGELNIARKELGNEWLQNLVRLNGGCMSQPVSVRNLGLTLKEGLLPLETASVRVR